VCWLPSLSVLLKLKLANTGKLIIVMHERVCATRHSGSNGSRKKENLGAGQNFE
jgi:hypothetical protein